MPNKVDHENQKAFSVAAFSVEKQTTSLVAQGLLDCKAGSLAP